MASALQGVGTRWRMGRRRRSWCFPPTPVLSSLAWALRKIAALATAAPAAGPGVLRPAPCQIMTPRPPLLPPRLLPLLLLLLSGAAGQAEPGFETESPVRTLQVETLVRSLAPVRSAGQVLSVNTGLSAQASREEKCRGCVGG